MARTKEVALSVKQIAARLSDNYLFCRDFGHEWKLYRQRPNGRNIERDMWCPSCKTNRKQIVNRRGEVVKNRYDYDPSYLISGFGHLGLRGKSVLRVESINRSPEIDMIAELSKMYPELAEYAEAS